MKVTQEDKKFIEKNWLKMSNTEIAAKLEISKTHVTTLSQQLGLPSKRIVSICNKESLKKIEQYPDSFITSFEGEGRGKTIELCKIKNQFHISDKLRIQSDQSIIKGIVIQKTNSLIVIQTENYKESFKYIDFYTRRAVVM